MPLVLSGDGSVGPLSATEVGYLDGVTSAVQTQINGKLTTPGAWTSYTPSLTAVTTNPTLGTGSTSTGYYTQIGKLVVVRFGISFGTSGVNAGSGSYIISLPVANSTSGGPIAMTVGNIFLFDSSSSNTWSGVMAEVASTQLGPIYYGAGGVLGTVSATAPWAWAAGDQIRGTVMYEAA